MKQGDQLQDIEDLLDVLEEKADGKEHVSVKDVLEVTGQRAYGPIIMAVGLLTASPIGAIPTLPTITAAIVFLVSAQMIFSPRSLWLPGFLLRRSIASERLKKAVSLLRKPARFVDRLIRPRLTMFAQGQATIVIGLVCMLLAVVVPVVELIPFAGMLPAAAFAAFGLGLTAHDGLLALAAFIVTSVAFYLVGSTFL